MFKALQQVFADWEQSIVTDPETGDEKIIVSCRYVPTNAAFRVTVDSDTKLIDKAGIRSKSRFSDAKVHIDAREFAYNQDISPGTFALPEGVVVIDEAARKKAEPLLEEAAQLYEEKQYAEALALLQRVCDEYPGLPDEVASAHLVRGHCYRALGQNEEAIKAYQEGIDKVREGGIQRPRYFLAVAYLGIGRTHMELEQNAEALEAFEACVRECEGAPEPEKWFRQEALEQIEKLRKP
jgi:tetratricopeptide (TPR) repeat protein